jgi:hypothetical protein
MRGAKVFVAVVYVILGATFLASSGVLIGEFRADDWFGIVVAHSHLFFFFAVFGILALVAFYLPSVVFTHLYWSHLPYGRLRYVLGLIVVAALSGAVGWWLDAKPRAIWEVSPRALAADKGETVACRASDSTCRRAPILDVLASLRVEAQHRVGLSKFARTCAVDTLLDMPDDMTKERWCFPAQAPLDGNACCRVQARFAEAVARLEADPAQRSLTAKLDVVFMPLKIFFIVILVAIGGLLAAWRNKLDEHYRELVPDLERGIIIGAVAMLFWPLMDYGYQQTANALFGRWVGTQIRLSLVIAPWALLLLFYFLRHLGAYSAIVGQISGVVVAAVYVLRYESLNDWAVRLLGIGADMGTMLALVGIALLGLALLLWPHGREAEAPTSFGAKTP